MDLSIPVQITDLPPCPDEADLLRQQLREACGCKRWEFDNPILGCLCLLLGAREIGRSWWCFDNEDFFPDPLPAICSLNPLKTLRCTRSQRIRANEREYVRAYEAKSCYLLYLLLSRPRPIFAGTLIFHDLSLSLLRSSQLVQFVQKFLRVLDRGWASSWIWWPCCGKRGLAVTNLWPSLSFHVFGEAIRKELTATRSRTSAL